MFNTIRTLLRRFMGRPENDHSTPISSAIEDMDAVNEALPNEAHFVPYDENLLECARTQWQFGDWDSLMKLERDTLQHHPDRAKLALLAAAGHLQHGNTQVARQFVQLAKDWGCSKKLISQILIAGVHNSLGRAAAVNGESQRALQHFESAIAAGGAVGEIRLWTQARLSEQLAQLRLPKSSIQLTPSQSREANL